MKAPVSLCIIVKNEPKLEECLLSIKDYVEEIVIIDTGSNDGVTVEIAKKYANVFESYTDCNDPVTGLIDDFAKARNYSLSKATQPWVMWMDSDDKIIGGENLIKIINSYEQNKSKDQKGVGFLFPYEYSYDETGKVNCIHYRERLMTNGHFHFLNKVHECAIPINNDGIVLVTSDEIVWKHQRQYTNKPVEPGRNLRILKKHMEGEGSQDPRSHYYIGLELANSGDFDNSIKYLSKYVEISGWPEEVAMATLRLYGIYLDRGDQSNALKWAFKTIETQENWGEGYFALAKIFYQMATAGGINERRNWEKCAHFAKMGLACPPTKTVLFINPADREYDIHRYLNMALNKLGDVTGALESAETALLYKPDDAALLLNRNLYRAFLARQEIMRHVDVLKSTGAVDQSMVDNVAACINNQPAPNVIKNATVEKSVSTDVFPPAGSTPDGQTWAVPNLYDYESYPIKMTDDQMQAVVIQIWKQYMLHDEVLSAVSFLENAPYRVRHTFATQKALKLTTSCLDWMDNKSEFQAVNAPANPEVESGTPLPQKLYMSEGHRFDLIADHLKPGSTLVDFGSMDGCFTNRYGMLGHKPVGLDVCESSVKLARKKAIQFNTGAEYVCTYFQDAVNKVPNNHFEYATSSDTYEHIKDPVMDMFKPAYKMLKEDGKFLLCTPNGAWTRGQYVPWAHPWIWQNEGKSWLQSSPRAHLIAPTVWTVAKQLREAGYWVKDCYADLSDNTNDSLQRDIVGQGNVFAEAWKKAPEGYDKGLDIVFFAGDGIEHYTPQTVKKTGIGGSELQLIEISKRLASLGHKVRVYNGCGEFGEGIYDGVSYLHTNKFQDLECDVLIVSRNASALEDHCNVKANLKLIWVHDLYIANYKNELALKADRILALSDFHKQFLLQAHNLHPEHIIKTRNGIDLNRFKNKNIKRDRFKCINSSSPDRSVPVLLQIWPEIKKRVPQATLHLYYGYKNWEYSAQWDKGQQDLIVFLKNKMKEMEPLGVVFHDRVNQAELANEFLSAGCWLFPSWFSESYCIGAAEAQAAGLRIVTSSIAALNETVGDRGILIPGAWTDKEYQDKFIDAAVKAMTDENEDDRLSLQKYAEDHFCLDRLSSDWSEMFKELLENKKTNPIVPYMPTPAYRDGGNGYGGGDPRFGKK